LGNDPLNIALMGEAVKGVWAETRFEEPGGVRMKGMKNVMVD